MYVYIYIYVCIYIYICIYICVCVCVCVCDNFYIINVLTFIRVSFVPLYMTEHLGKQPDNGNLYQWCN